MADLREDSHGAVVIGAGVIGSAVALELARMGMAPLVIDKGPAPGHGSTSASSAIIRFTYTTEAGTALAYESLEFWRNWADHVSLPTGTALTRFVECGMVFLDDPTEIVAKLLPPLDAVGVEYEIWDTDELTRRLPNISAGQFWPPTRPDDDVFWAEPASQVKRAVFTPEAGFVSDPQLAAQNLADAAVAAGATFRFRSEVAGIDRTDGRVRGLRLADGTSIESPIVVNAGGPFSRTLNLMAGLDPARSIGTRALRQQVDHVVIPDHLDADLPVIGDLDSGIYMRSDLGHSMLVGGTEPDCDPLLWLDDPDEVDLELDADEWQAHTLRLARRIPELGVPHDRRGVVGVYDASDDWKPIYDRTDLDGFYVAIGSSGNQFKNAPIAGYCMARLIAAVEDGLDHDNEPLVVVGPNRGQDLDLGAFSRRRPFDADGNHNVIG